MKKLVLILTLTFISFKSYAQQSDLYLIKLKSGLVIKAELVKIVPDSFVTIKQYGLDTKIKMADVAEIIFNSVNPNLSFKKGKNAVFKKNIPDSGWIFGYGGGISLGLVNGNWGPFPTSSFISRVSALKSISKRAQVGVQLGFDPYSYYNFSVFSTEAHIRQYLTYHTNSSFIYGNLGYGLNITKGNPFKNGGINYCTGIGHSYRTRNQKVFSCMVGIKSQRASYEDNFFDWRTNNPTFQTHILNIRRIELKVELLF